MIYLDSAATTRPYDEVVDVVADVMHNQYGNASAIYQFGKQSKDIIDGVRSQFSDRLRCRPEDIIFTSGACEANSMVINYCKENNISFITSKLEHKSIELGAKSCNSLYVYNDSKGNVDIGDLSLVLRSMPVDAPKVVSVCAANGEIGTIQNLDAISKVVHRYGGLFHCDATQLFPYQRINMSKLNIDMLSLSAQKFHGPKGIGLLACRNVEMQSLIYGSQEAHRRGGTYNTPLIAGMGKALELSDKNIRVRQLKSGIGKIWKVLSELGSKLLGADFGTNRLPNHLSVLVPGALASDIISIAEMYGLCLSSGSACNAGSPEASQTLIAIGLSEEEAESVIRITIDDLVTTEEINEVCEKLKSIVLAACNRVD